MILSYSTIQSVNMKKHMIICQYDSSYWDILRNVDKSYDMLNYLISMMNDALVTDLGRFKEKYLCDRICKDLWLMEKNGKERYENHRNPTCQNLTHREKFAKGGLDSPTSSDAISTLGVKPWRTLQKKYGSMGGMSCILWVSWTAQLSLANIKSDPNTKLQKSEDSL